MTVASSGMGIQRAEVERVLESVGFGGEMRGAAISSLSGGWKMKLALGAPRKR
jgi:ATPase subunit of ABC transporter with duplicated ATPase domains